MLKESERKGQQLTEWQRQRKKKQKHRVGEITAMGKIGDWCVRIWCRAIHSIPLANQMYSWIIDKSLINNCSAAAFGPQTIEKKRIVDVGLAGIKHIQLWCEHSLKKLKIIEGAAVY